MRKIGRENHFSTDDEARFGDWFSGSGTKRDATISRKS